MSLSGFNTTEASEDGVDSFYTPKASSADTEPEKKTKDHSKDHGSASSKLTVEEGTTSVALFTGVVSGISVPLSLSLSLSLFLSSLSLSLSVSLSPSLSLCLLSLSLWY